jgi:hypothetical protein
MICSLAITARLLPIALLTAASADVVILKDDSSLAGTITTFSDKGKIELSSPLSFEPFQLRADHLARVYFNNPHVIDYSRPSTLIMLKNGDLFPASLTALDEGIATVETNFAGKLTIPRTMIDNIRFGVGEHRLVYKGPENPEGWTMEDSWRFDSSRFVASGNGTLSGRFDTPKSFSLSFRLTWQNVPNFQIYFAADSVEATGRADRYYLQFANAGLEIKRQQSGKGQTYLPIASVPCDPLDFNDANLHVELRIDRKSNNIHLYLDEKFIGKYQDPLNASPTGTGIMFRSNIQEGDEQSIDEISINEWDASKDRHQTEERGDKNQDVVIARNSDRGIGSILSLVPGPDGGSIRYKGPHQPEPLDLPLEEISTIFFTQPDEPKENTRPAFLLGLLRPGAALSVMKCDFSGDSIKLLHPLLGELTLRRDSATSLTRNTEARDTTPTQEEE